MPTLERRLSLSEQIVERILTESQLPVCRLEFFEEEFSLTDSHLGGVPYLPRETPYPCWEGQPLWLCAQLNFAQLPPLEGFPASGILQLFLSDWDYDGGFGFYSGEPEEQGPWRLLWHPEIDPTITLADCAAKMPLSWEEGSDLWRCPAQPLKIRFSPAATEGVNDTDHRFQQRFLQAAKELAPDVDPETLDPFQLYEGLPNDRSDPLHVRWEALRRKTEQGGCKIGGYPRFEQDDLREPAEEWAEGELPDILLFQLDDNLFTYPAGPQTDLDLELNGGTLNLLIRKEDLQNQNFQKVYGQWACS